MIDILLFALSISLWCMAWSFATDEHWPLQWLGDLLPYDKWYHKPLWGCPPCMSSVHGVLLWFIFQPVTLWELPFSIIFAFAITRLCLK